MIDNFVPLCGYGNGLILELGILEIEMRHTSVIHTNMEYMIGMALDLLILDVA
jgi:hypothetical protein